MELCSVVLTSCIMIKLCYELVVYLHLYNTVAYLIQGKNCDIVFFLILFLTFPECTTLQSLAKLLGRHPIRIFLQYQPYDNSTRHFFQNLKIIPFLTSLTTSDAHFLQTLYLLNSRIQLSTLPLASFYSSGLPILSLIAPFNFYGYCHELKIFY